MPILSTFGAASARSFGLGAGGKSLGWYFVYDPHPYDVDEDTCFNDVVIASDDTIICAGNQNNTKTILVSFNTNGAVQNTRQISNSGSSFRQGSGVGLAINSSDRVNVVFPMEIGGASNSNTGYSRWGSTVLNKDLTTAMSTSNRMSYGVDSSSPYSDRNAINDHDKNYCSSALGDDDRMYWPNAFTDGSGFNFQYKVANVSKSSSEGSHLQMIKGDGVPHLVSIANDKLAMCYAVDGNNGSDSRMGVIDTDYNSTASSDQNIEWKANMSFGNGHFYSLFLRDIAYDGSTYLYGVADLGNFNTSGDSSQSIGIVKVAASNGALQWIKKYKLSTIQDLNGNAGKFSGVRNAIDSNGNMFFLGEGAASGTSHLVFGKILANGNGSWCHELKWDSASSVQSGQTFTRAGNFENSQVRSGIAVDSNDNVYIATSAREIVSGSNKRAKPFLIKVNNDGTTVGDFGDFEIVERNSFSLFGSNTGDPGHQDIQYNLASAGSGTRLAYGIPDGVSSNWDVLHVTHSTSTSIGSTDYQLNKM